MSRLIIPFVLLGSWLCPEAACAQPNFGIRCADRPGSRVEVTYVDPGGLARQMGLQPGDILAEINWENNAQVIRSNEDAVRAFRQLHGKYRIVLQRVESMSGGKRTVQKTLEGEVRQAKDKKGSFYVVRQEPR
jgi:C-terminal processing protease CtpA/Prc